MIIIVTALGMFTQSTETFNVLSVFLAPMNAEFGWTRTQFAGAMSLGSLLGGAIALFVGPLIDRFGPRVALGIAFGLVGAAFVLMNWITTLWEFYALQTIARMMSNGVTGVALGIIIPKWFIEKRGRAVAFGSIGSQAGSTITPLYVQLLVNLYGWRVAAVVAGIVIWILSFFPAIIFMRRQPEDLGLLPDGVIPKVQEGNSVPAADLREPQISLGFHEAKRIPSYYLLIASICTTWLIRTGVTLHMIPFFMDHGFSSSLAVLVLACYASSGVLGAVIWGYAADRFGARRSLTLDTALIGVGAFALLGAANAIWLAFAWAVFWGVVLTGQMTLQKIIFADYFGRGRLGSISGVVTAFQTIAQALGPVVAAVAYDTFESYFFALVGFSLVSFLGSACVFFPGHQTGLMVKFGMVTNGSIVIYTM